MYYGSGRVFRSVAVGLFALSIMGAYLSLFIVSAPAKMASVQEYLNTEQSLEAVDFDLDRDED